MGKFSYRGKPWPKKYDGPHYEAPAKPEPVEPLRPKSRLKILRRKEAGIYKRLVECPSINRYRNLLTVFNKAVDETYAEVLRIDCHRSPEVTE